MNLLPTDCFHVLIGLAAGVSCTLIIGKGRIFKPLRNNVSQRESAVCRLLTAILHCQQCLGFWIGLATGFILFNPLWAILMALLVSLLAVWNDFALAIMSQKADSTVPIIGNSGTETNEVFLSLDAFNE
jgi:hypothetical protein